MKASLRYGWGIAVLALATIAMPGCVPVTQIDPEPLYLQPTAPYVTNIKVENGAGDVLYDGKHPGSNTQITANPTPEQLDGTVTITRTYSDGNVKRQTLTYEAGKPLKVGYRDSTDSYFVDKPPELTFGRTGIYGALNPSYTFVNRPDTAIVRRDQGGALAGVVKADNDSSHPAFNGSIGYKFENKFLGAKVGIELQGSYYSATARDDRETIQAGTNDLAIFGPVAGGGVNFLNNDFTNVRYRSDYTAWSLQPRLTKSYGLGTIYGTPVRMNSYMGFNFGKNEDDQEFSGDVPGAGLEFMSVNKIDNWYYGPEGGFYAAWDVCPMTKFTIGGFVNFNVNELSADRSLDVPTFTSGTDELSGTEFTVGGGANIGLHLKLTDQISAQARFDYKYANNTPTVNINQATSEASVNTEAADIYAITLGAKINF